ncbi:MAG: hypothetical protein C4320_08240, partial [Armatimonadota bacterium]
APSAKNLIRKDFQITKERGRYFPCEFARTAMATLHPSYILRQQRAGSDGGYGLLVDDLARAYAAAEKLRDVPVIPAPLREVVDETEQGSLF